MAASPIPIRNLYYLFCYAWDRFPEGKSVSLGSEEAPDIWELFAKVLARAVARLLRRGLDRGYLQILADTQSVRGKIIIGETLRRHLLQNGKVHCEFDDLKHDVLHNQIIKATIRLLTAKEGLDRSLADELRGTLRLLGQVSDIRLSPSLFRRLQIPRHIGDYDLLMKICHLVFSCLLPSERGVGSKFASIVDDEEKMSAVFEAFVRNFFRTEQSHFSVRSERIVWNAEIPKLEDGKLLPTMLTDVTLRSHNRNIIIDAKFYSDALQRRHGEAKVRSSHLYQLFAYLSNFRSSTQTSAPAEGLLVYPLNGKSLSLSYRLGQHPVRVVTVDLDRPWKDIHAQMLDLLRHTFEQPLIPLIDPNRARA